MANTNNSSSGDAQITGPTEQAPTAELEAVLVALANDLGDEKEHGSAVVVLGQNADLSGKGKKRPLSPKAIRILGDPALFPEKARKVLGTNELSTSAHRRVLIEREAAYNLRLSKRREALEQRCAAKPSAAQLALPRPNERVSDKALRVLGEPALVEASKRVVTDSERKCAKAHPKVLQILGEPAVAGQVACKRLGSDMTASQRKAQLLDKRATELRRDAEHKRMLEERLKAHPSAEQLQLPNNQKRISDKALRFFGEPMLEELARKVVTPEMRKNVSPKTLRLLGPETELLSKKQRQLLGSNLESVSAPPKHGLWSMVRANMPSFITARA